MVQNFTEDFNEKNFADQLESLAEFSAGAGHEINNPLATISGRVQLLLRTETDPEKRRALETIGGQAYRIRDMIGDAMLFGRPPEPALEPLDLGEAVRSVMELLATDCEEAGCRFELSAMSAVPIWADAVQLNVVISNFLRNSFEAVADAGAAAISGTIFIDCKPSEKNGRHGAELIVADNGCGLSELDRRHLFDPFYSGRQAGRGLGFGLSKCWRIVSNHGGTVEVGSTSEAKTVFRVWWPASS